MFRRNNIQRLLLALIFIANVKFFSVPGSYRLFSAVCDYHNKILVCLLVFLFFAIGFRRRLRIPKREWPQRVTLVFLSLVLVTAVYSLLRYPGQSLFHIIRKYYYLSAVILIFPLMGFFRQRRDNVLWFVNLIAVIGLVYSVYTLFVKVVYEATGALLIDNRMQIIQSRGGSLRLARTATFIGPATVLSLTMLLKSHGSHRVGSPLLYLLSTVFGIINIFFISQTRAMEIAMIAFLFLMVFFRSRHLGRTLILVVMLCALPLILQIVNSYRSSFTGGADYASTTIRLSGYAYFLSHAFDGGLLGMGLIGSPSYYHILFGPEGRYNLSDDGYFGFLGMYGVLGLIFLIYLFARLIKLLMKVMRQRKLREFPEALGYLVYFAVTGWSLFFTDPQRCLYLPLFLSMFWITQLELENAVDLRQSVKVNFRLFRRGTRAIRA